MGIGIGMAISELSSSDSQMIVSIFQVQKKPWNPLKIENSRAYLRAPSSMWLCLRCFRGRWSGMCLAWCSWSTSPSSVPFIINIHLHSHQYNHPLHPHYFLLLLTIVIITLLILIFVTISWEWWLGLVRCWWSRSSPTTTIITTTTTMRKRRYSSWQRFTLLITMTTQNTFWYNRFSALPLRRSIPPALISNGACYSHKASVYQSIAN